MTELVEGARLEIVWLVNSWPEGSNPSLSAISQPSLNLFHPKSRLELSDVHYVSNEGLRMLLICSMPALRRTVSKRTLGFSDARSIAIRSDLKDSDLMNRSRLYSLFHSEQKQSV